jgi:hypothetical protein
MQLVAMMEAQPYDTAEMSRMYHVADERSAIIHPEIIRKSHFQSSIRAETRLRYP